MTASYLHYWGKAAKSDDQPGDAYHLLPYHSLDVAAVGWHILDPTKPLCRDMASYLDVAPALLQQMLCFSLAIHDIGKFADAFQRLRPFAEYSNLGLPKAIAYDAKLGRHDLLGHVFFDRFITQHGSSTLFSGVNEHDDRTVKKTLAAIFNAFFSHHGYPAEPGGLQLRRSQDYCNAENWCHCDEFILEAASLFHPNFPNHWLGDK